MTDISVRGLTKRFGSVTAVDALTFDAPAGQITGFLGPNGAGKTTTLRMLLGLATPTAGEALIGGRRYDQLADPRRVVGAVLDSSSSHPGRSGRAQLRILARGAGVSDDRVDRVLELVALTGAADRHIPGYSLGMRQRLGLAAALLGDPEVLLLDEPANGLDPEGIAWLRTLLRSLAAEGRTVVISSHLLSEVAQTVDRVVIVDHGRLRFEGPLEGLGSGAVSVESPEAERLAEALRGAGFEPVSAGASRLEVRGASAEAVGRVAAEHSIVLAGLDGNVSLESAFLRLTSGDSERAGSTPKSSRSRPLQADR